MPEKEVSKPKAEELESWANKNGEFIGAVFTSSRNTIIDGLYTVNGEPFAIVSKGYEGGDKGRYTVLYTEKQAQQLESDKIEL